jgi:hypothetical protein
MPEDQKKYGSYLGPSRDVGSFMTSKILNDKSNTVYHLSFRALTQDEFVGLTKGSLFRMNLTGR